MRAGFVATIATVLTVGSLSCGLFDTRNPVKPGVATYRCHTLIAPDSVVANILETYGRPDRLGCYGSTLATFVSSMEPGFMFHPDPTDSLEAPAGAFDMWDKAKEEGVAAIIANSANPDSFHLAFKFPYEVIDDQVDFKIRRYTYEIRYRDRDANAAFKDSLFQGLAELTIRKGTGNEWQVTDWVDRRDPSGTTTRTWGYLRWNYSP